MTELLKTEIFKLLNYFDYLSN